MADSGAIKFLLFYSVFISFVFYITASAGAQIFLGDNVLGNTPTTINPFNPIETASFFVTLLTLSTEYQILTILLLTPFIIVLIYIIIDLFWI